MGFILDLLAMLILLTGGAYYGYWSGFYNFRQFGGGVFVIFTVLMMFFILARPE